jgi:hypothetical protein
MANGNRVFWRRFSLTFSNAKNTIFSMESTFHIRWLLTLGISLRHGLAFSTFRVTCRIEFVLVAFPAAS